MLAELNLPLLQDRRKVNRLTFFFKVVEGIGGAGAGNAVSQLFDPCPGKTSYKMQTANDCVTSNLIDKQSTNNSKYFKTVQCKKEIHRNSFFPRTIIDWNHLEDNIVRADTVDSRYSLSSLPVASTLKDPAT